MNHPPAFHDVVSGFVCFWYKYYFSRVPIPDVVRQSIIDKASKADRAFPEPIPDERITDVIQSRARIRRAASHSRFQLNGWLHFNDRRWPWLFVAGTQLGSDKVRYVLMPVHHSTISGSHRRKCPPLLQLSGQPEYCRITGRFNRPFYEVVPRSQ